MSADTAVRAITCPRCGAGLVVPAGRRAAPCAACGSRCALLGAVAEQRVRVVPQVDALRAVAIVRTALSQWPVAAGVAAIARFAPPELVYAPVCDYEALEAGTITLDQGLRSVRGGHVDFSTGRRRFLDDDGREIAEQDYYHRRIERIRDTRVILRTHRACFAAAGPDEWTAESADLDALRDAGAQLEPFGAAEVAEAEKEGAVVLWPHRGRTEARDAARRLATTPNDTARQDFVAEEMRYVFVPVWIVRWRAGSHPYAAVVDGVRGRLLDGRAPEAKRRGALFVGLVAAFLGFVVGKLAAAVATDPSSVAVLLTAIVKAPLFTAFAAAFVLLPLAYAWGEFRYRGEVVFSPRGPEVRKFARPPETGIERFAARLCKAVDDALLKSKEDRE